MCWVPCLAQAGLEQRSGKTTYDLMRHQKILDIHPVPCPTCLPSFYPLCPATHVPFHSQGIRPLSSLRAQQMGGPCKGSCSEVLCLGRGAPLSCHQIHLVLSRGSEVSIGLWCEVPGPWERQNLSRLL